MTQLNLKYCDIISHSKEQKVKLQSLYNIYIFHLIEINRKVF